MNKAKIGLEIHGYLSTDEKLFCKCSARYMNTIVNTNICPICTGQPGSKPMLPNKSAMDKVIAIALMLGCKVNSQFIWQRKHYDWPDMPKGYQNTISGAHSIPVAEKGNFLGIRITESHLEEDPARWDPQTGNVDYNRSGVPLIEIVTEPDFKNSKQVQRWLNQLLKMIGYIGAVDADAGLKADVNVSVNVNGKQGNRVEVKNINSIDSITKAIDFEILRQTELLQKGERVVMETRAYIDTTRETVSMRSKEKAQDYRFIPEPDLPIVELSKKGTEKIKSKLPELPHLKVQRFIKQYKIDEYTAGVLTANLDIANFFEEVLEKVKDLKIVSQWVTIELLRVLNWNKKSLSEISIKLEHFTSLLNLIKQGKVTELAAKRILNDFVPKSFNPEDKLKALSRVTDKKEIEVWCKEAMKINKKAVEDFKKGEKNSFNFLMGVVMKLSERRADSNVVREVLAKLLKK
ncbi:Asp-tRNA(Asn)/Glu-tRNA(Gln) amidotransferase subunit GatB [Nanoarchaeota archaeon]